MKFTAIALLFVVSTSCLAGPLYRFKVDGKTVLKDQVPPEYLALGYEVLNRQGIVIRVVAPALTAEQIAANQAQEAAKKARQEATLAQREKDTAMLRLYAGLLDIERARQSKLDEIETKTQELRNRVTNIEKNLESAQSQAATFERRGQDIPADLRLEVVNLQNQIRDYEQSIRASKQSLLSTQQEFNQLRLRFRILQVYPPGTLTEDVDFEQLDKVLGADQH